MDAANRARPSNAAYITSSPGLSTDEAERDGWTAAATLAVVTATATAPLAGNKSSYDKASAAVVRRCSDEKA